MARDLPEGGEGMISERVQVAFDATAPDTTATVVGCKAGGVALCVGVHRKAHADRIATLWNACLGVPTEDLETCRVVVVNRELIEAMAQRLYEVSGFVPESWLTRSEADKQRFRDWAQYIVKGAKV